LIRGAIAAHHLKAKPQANGAGAVEDSAEPLSSSATAGGAVLGPDVYRQEAFRLGEELWSAAIRDRLGRPE